MLSAGLLVALYSATGYGLVLTLGAGKVDTLETEIATAALRDLDLNFALALALLQTALTLCFFYLARSIGAEPAPLFGEQENCLDRLQTWWLARGDAVSGNRDCVRRGFRESHNLRARAS